MKPGAALLAVAFVLAATTVCAQSLGPASAGLRVESEFVKVRGGRTVVRGYVYNDHTMGAENIRLRIEQVDGAARPVATRFSSVIGTVSPGQRVYFEVGVGTDATYRVSVESFDRVGCGSG